MAGSATCKQSITVYIMLFFKVKVCLFSVFSREDKESLFVSLLINISWLKLQNAPLT